MTMDAGAGGIGGAGRRVALALVLLAALVFRAAIPAGWMPNLQGQGGAPLVICTGAGAHLLRPAAPGVPTTPHSADRHDICAFAGLASAPPAPAIAFVQPPRLAVVAQLDPRAEAALRPPLRHREQAARAPPIRV
jgi:hypothetical protein